jgi:hypothetical protein
LLAQREKETEGGFAPGGGVGGGGEGSWVISAMATDMIDKQAALVWPWKRCSPRHRHAISALVSLFKWHCVCTGKYCLPRHRHAI